MRINQRNKEELVEALKAVELALVENPTKAKVLKTLADMGWCSSGSTGIEKSFLAAVKSNNVDITPLFAKLMGEPVGVGPASEPEHVSTLKPDPKPATEPSSTAPAPGPSSTAPAPGPSSTAPAPEPITLSACSEKPGDFTLLNLKAVSLIQAKGSRTSVRFIGTSENVLTGGFDVSCLRSNCNLIEFSI